MAEHPNEALVRRGYDAFSAGDMATLSELMAPDVVHEVPGDTSLSGEHKGQAAVFELYGQLAAQSDGTVKVEVLDVRAEGDDRVVARHRATAARGGKTLDVIQTIEFTIEDGKVTRLDGSSDDLEAENQFWS
jgi:ketosteroid isomerase-like protein